MRCPLPDHLPLGTSWQGRQGPRGQQQVPVGTRGHHQLQAGGGQSLPPTPPPHPGGSLPGNLRDGFLSPGEDGGLSHPGLGGDAVGCGCPCEEPPRIAHRHLPPGDRCPAVPLPAGGVWPAGSPREDGPGRLQQREGSCITIQYNLSPFPLPSSRGDGYCLIPFDSSFIICLPPSSIPVVPPRLLCGRNQSLVSDGCSGGGREGTAERGWLARRGGEGARPGRAARMGMVGPQGVSAFAVWLLQVQLWVVAL